MLLLNIIFVKLVSQYNMFREAATIGELITVEKIYNEYLPIFMHLRKHNYYSILLDQTEEYYDRIPYHILQLIRENRFQKLYDGTDRRQNSLSHWVIDALMELMNKNVKELYFPNTIDGWQLHSQNIMLALASSSFVMNEQTNHQSLDVQNAKNSGLDNYIDMSQKGNTKTKLTPLNQSKEKILCCEILLLAHTFKETHQRNFDNNTYWDMLSSTTTKIGKDSNEPDDHDDPDKISKFTASIFDHNRKTKDDYMVNHSLLDNDVMSALNGDLVNTGDTDNNDDDSPIIVDSITEPEKVSIDVENDIGTKSTTVKKVNIHESTTVNIFIKGRDEMKSKTLPAAQYRKKCGIKREQVSLRDSIYESMMNTHDNNIFNVIIGEINQKEDGNIF